MKLTFVMVLCKDQLGNCHGGNDHGGEAFRYQWHVTPGMNHTHRRWQND